MIMTEAGKNRGPIITQMRKAESGLRPAAQGFNQPSDFQRSAGKQITFKRRFIQAGHDAAGQAHDIL